MRNRDFSNAYKLLESTYVVISKTPFDNITATKAANAGRQAGCFKETFFFLAEAPKVRIRCKSCAATLLPGAADG